MQVAKQIVIITIAIGFVLYLINQCRKPHGWLGRFFLWEMGGRHAELTDWGLSHVSIEKDFSILDVGCGGGRAIAKLAAVAPASQVCGIDYSRASVAASRSRNRQAIVHGQVEIQQGSVSQLPFPDDSFNLVTAVETHYYWPNLIADLREILRVLKPGGRLLILAEAYRRRSVEPTSLVMRSLRASFLTKDQHRELFEQAGYAEIQMFEETGKGWLCASGKKPEAA